MSTETMEATAEAVTTSQTTAAAESIQTTPAETTQQTTTSEAPPPKIGPDGKLADDWFLALGDEFAPHAKDLGKHKDIRSILTELDYFRKNGVEYPGEGAPQSSIERFRKIAGVPDDPNGYGLTAEAMNLPEGMEFDSELAEHVAKAAHAAHAPPAAVAAIAKTFNEILAKRTADAVAAQQKAHQEAQDALVAEWRGDFATNASTVRHIAGKLAESAGVSEEGASALANNPDFARIMLSVAKLTQEDGIRTPTGFGDLRSAEQKISDIKEGRDPHWSAKYNSKLEADKLAAYEHIKRLREQAEA